MSVDFNSVIGEGKVAISQEEIARLGDRVEQGMSVILHEGDFESDGVLRREKEGGSWYAEFKEREFRNHVLWNDERSNRWEWGATEQIFLLRTSRLFWGPSFRRQTLPELLCPHCLPWTASWYEYPLANIPDPEGFYQPLGRAVSIEEFRELQRVAQNVVGPDLPVPPGAEFGQLRMVVVEPLRTGLNLAGYHFIKSFALESLRREGLEIQTVKVDALYLSWKEFDPYVKQAIERTLAAYAAKEPFDDAYGLAFELAKADLLKKGVSLQDPTLFEIIALPLARVSERCFTGGFPEPCPVCGRRALAREPEKLILDSEYIPRGVHFFAARNMPQLTLVTESLMNAVRKLKLDEGVTFERVECR